ncbi:MAG TPA: AMP-binding protein, partial [Candidatus Sulfotelmatobacter sp.]|nr:AMP-binding protein [Candidatus Sulfotelmatobacter sp.]
NPDLLEALTRSAHWPACDLSHVRFIITGGAPVPLRLIHVYASRGVSLLQGYGLSEASPVVLLLDAGSAAGKPGSAGKPVLLVDVRVAGPDGLPCESGETGELLVRGPNVMAGYWNLPEDTRQAIDADGWLHTGDAARLDEDGFVWIVDRVRDRYLSRGRVVYPGDVERVLVGHPGVADAGVVGVPGAGAGVATGAPEDGELTGAAFVVREQGAAVSADDLLELCRRSLAPYQVPVSLTFTEQLPRSSVGKLLRADLRRLAER